MAKDLYEVLGVARGASDEEIKKAYRKMAIKLHPDKFATASPEEKKKADDEFKEINHAYDVLGDPQKKANYDQYGSEEGPQGFGGFGGGQGGGDFGGFDDILSSFFGGGFGGGRRSNPNGPQPGEDIQVKVNLTFEEAYNGVKKTIRVNREEVCPDCNGLGAKSASDIKTCPSCGGSGYIRKTQNTIFGQQVVQQVCPNCGGTGKVITDKCKTCRGTGKVRKESSITVNIPAGVDSGISMTIRNEGNAGKNGGPKGNLILLIYVEESSKFRKVGSDLYTDVPLSLSDAINGSTVTINTMKGEATFKVPSGTQSGTKIRVRGYGMKYLKKDAYGDLYITIKVEIPKSLNSKQEKLLKAFEESLSDSQYPQIKKFKSQK